jgi:hypothetical protein
MSCTSDKRARVRCVKGKLERDDCDGPKGCFPKTETTMGCEKALRVGAACSLDGDWCSDDHVDWLQCQKGKLVTVAKCRGPAGCKAFGETIACDTAFGDENEPCVGTSEACSVDKKAILECASGRFRVRSTCPTGRTCASGPSPACK